MVLEENNTANILLGLSSNSPCKDLDSSSFLDIANGILGPAAFQNKDPLLNTNSKINTNNPSKTSIIDQLRSVVRAEAMIFLKPKFDSSFSNLNKLKQSNSEQFETSDDIEENDFDGDLDEDSESSLFKDGKSRARSISNLSEEGVDTVVRYCNKCIFYITTLTPFSHRKERNRMHAKLTRDRKKMFTSRLQLLIQNLEYQNQVLRQRLRQNAVAGGSATSSNVTDSGDASSNYSLASANRSSIDNSGFSDQRSTSSNDSLNLDFQQKNNDSEKSDQTNVLSLSSFQSKRKYSSENKN